MKSMNIFEGVLWGFVILYNFLFYIFGLLLVINSINCWFRTGNYIRWKDLFEEEEKEKEETELEEFSYKRFP